MICKAGLLAGIHRDPDKYIVSTGRRIVIIPLIIILWSVYQLGISL